ncbi:DNA replication protein, partial [Rhodopseudomonas sp. BR0G17]|nr:DNA replication protein [Rhodopseudomonas sp. BR0G17]
MQVKRRGRKSTTPRAQGRAEVDGFRASHLDLTERDIMTADGLARVTMDDSESPLAWLA